MLYEVITGDLGSRDRPPARRPRPFRRDAERSAVDRLGAGRFVAADAAVPGLRAVLGSLMLATGSLGSNARESQQYSVVWSMLAVSPLILLQIFLTAPHGTLPRVLTWA